MTGHHKPYQSVCADMLLPHLADPIDAYALAIKVHLPFTACSSALMAMHRKGIVRKIVRRKGAMFLAHLWQAKS